MVNTVAGLKEVKRVDGGKAFGTGHWEVIRIQRSLMVYIVPEPGCLKGILGPCENIMCLR